MTATFKDDIRRRLASMEEALLRVRSALGRMIEGHSGVCAMCAHEIDEARLEAKPEAVFC